MPPGPEDTKAILDRREFLIRSALAAAGGVVMSGCDRKPRPQPRACLSIIPYDREKTYAHAEMFCLGDYCQKNLSNDCRKILVIVPFTNTNEELFPYQAAAKRNELRSRINALDGGLRAASREAGGEAPAELQKTDWQISQRVCPTTAADFDGLLCDATCDLAISLCPLPEAPKEMSFWQRDNGDRPKLILVGAQPHDLERPIRTGSITAVVVSNPNFMLGSERSDKGKRTDDPHAFLHALFRERYIIIDAKNIDEVKRKHPKMFRSSDPEKE